MVPAKWACVDVRMASRASKVTRHRNTFGRTMTLRLAASATISATGRAPCVMPLPTTVGICTIAPEYPIVLSTSRPQTVPILRRIQRSRSSAGASRGRPRLGRNTVAYELMGHEPGRWRLVAFTELG